MQRYCAEAGRPAWESWKPPPLCLKTPKLNPNTGTCSPPAVRPVLSPAMPRKPLPKKIKAQPAPEPLDEDSIQRKKKIARENAGIAPAAATASASAAAAAQPAAGNRKLRPRSAAAGARETQLALDTDTEAALKAKLAETRKARRKEKKREKRRQAKVGLAVSRPGSCVVCLSLLTPRVSHCLSKRRQARKARRTWASLQLSILATFHTVRGRGG